MFLTHTHAFRHIYTYTHRYTYKPIHMHTWIHIQSIYTLVNPEPHTPCAMTLKTIYPETCKDRTSISTLTTHSEMYIDAPHHSQYPYIPPPYTTYTHTQMPKPTHRSQKAPWPQQHTLQHQLSIAHTLHIDTKMLIPHRSPVITPCIPWTSCTLTPDSAFWWIT